MSLSFSQKTNYVFSEKNADLYRESRNLEKPGFLKKPGFFLSGERVIF
jgi:hypothetical protein